MGVTIIFCIGVDYFCLHIFAICLPSMASLDNKSEYKKSLRSLDTSYKEGSVSDNECLCQVLKVIMKWVVQEHGIAILCSLQQYHTLITNNLQHHCISFTGNSGMHIQGSILEMTPLDYFSLFMDQRNIDLVIEETSLFAEQNGLEDSLW